MSQRESRTLLEVEDLHVSFATSRGQLQAVQGVSFTLGQGKTLGIVGESGSGKTVLSRAVMGLLPRASSTQTGSVRYDTQEILNAPNDELRELWSTHIAMVFQDPMTSLNPVVKIGKQIIEPLRIHLKLRKDEAKETALSLLMQVGIPSPVERFDAYPFQLSGGMLTSGLDYIADGYWWLIVPAGLIIVLTVTAVNTIGDGLRDALDVRLRQR